MVQIVVNLLQPSSLLLMRRAETVLPNSDRCRGLARGHETFAANHHIHLGAEPEL